MNNASIKFFQTFSLIAASALHSGTSLAAGPLSGAASYGGGDLSLQIPTVAWAGLVVALTICACVLAMLLLRDARSTAATQALPIKPTATVQRQAKPRRAAARQRDWANRWQRHHRHFPVLGHA